MDEYNTALIENDEIKQKILETTYREGGETSRQQIVDELEEEGQYEGPQPNLAETEVDIGGRELEEEGYVQTVGGIRNATITLTEEGRKAFEIWAGLEPSVETGYQEITRLLESGDKQGAQEFLARNYEDDSTSYGILSEVYENRTGEEL